MRLQSVLNVRPCRDHRTQYHQAEAQQLHTRHAASEPEDLAVCDEDDGQVLEDGVYRDGEELESFGRGVDHANEEQRDGKPFAGLVDVEVAEGDEGGLFAALNRDDADNALQAMPLAFVFAVRVYCVC